MTGSAISTTLTTVRSIIFDLPPGVIIMVVGIAVFTLFLDIKKK